MPHNRKTVFRFADGVSTGSTEEYSEAIEDPATVERLEVRIYPGPQLDMHVEPYILKNGTDRQPMLNLTGKGYVDGDDDIWKFDIAEPVDAGDEILVVVTNNDVDNSYDFAVNVELDYAFGLDRAVSAVTHQIQGLF